MHARARIKLFGSLTVEVEGKRPDLGSSPTQQLLARLASVPNHWLERTAIAEDIWPDVEFAVSGNRLRTHLVYLKKSLDPWTPIETERSRMRFDSEGVLVDLETAEQFVKQLRIQRDHKEEQEVLRGLVAVIDNDFLEGWTSEWVAPIRAYWREHRADAYMRLARFAHDDDDLEGALVHIDRAIRADEFRAEAWAQFLRVMGRLGRGAHALARFRAARSKMKTEFEIEFPDELIELSRAVGRGAIGPGEGSGIPRKSFSLEEREMLINALERTAVSNPNILLQLFGTDAFRREVYKNPPVAFKMVNAAYNEGDGLDPSRVTAVWTILAAGTLLDEYDRKVELCQWVIDNLDEASQDHWAALSFLAFVNFEVREWDKAFELIEIARQNALKYEWRYSLVVCKAQLGSFNWQYGRLEEAEVLYRQVLEEYGEATNVREAHNLASLRINFGFLESIRGDWEACRYWTDLGWKAAVLHGLEGVLHWAFPLMGLAKIMGGERRAGCRMIIDGITLCYARRNVRMHEIGMDYAAAAMIEFGHHAEALAVIDAYASFRGKRRHERSPAEQRLVDSFVAKTGNTKPNPNWVGLSISEYILKVCALLEKADL